MRLRGRLPALLPVSLATEAFVLVLSSGRAGCPPKTCGLSVRLSAVVDGTRAKAELVRRTTPVDTNGDARREFTDVTEPVRTLSLDMWAGEGRPEMLRRNGLSCTLVWRVGVGGRIVAAVMVVVLLFCFCSVMASTFRPRIVITDCRLRQSASRSASSWLMWERRSSKDSRWRRSSASKIIFWRKISERSASMSSELISLVVPSGL